MPTRSTARLRWILAGSAVAVITAIGGSAAIAATNNDGAPSATSTSPTASGTTPAAATTTPAADILDVDFASGAPVDHAQGAAATAVGAPTVQTDTTLNEQVASFNGQTAYQFPFAQWSKLSSALSIECVFRYDGTAVNTTATGVCSDTNGGGAAIDINTGNKISFLVSLGGGYKYATAGAALTPGTWYDVLGTWDGSHENLFVNGHLAATLPVSGTLTPPDAAAQRFTLGADTSDGGAELYTPTTIARSSVWSSALGAADAQSLATAHGLEASTGDGKAKADILDVTFDSGAPVDHAQGLTATTVGAPQIADDADLGAKAATFNGTSDAYYFPFAAQWPKLQSGFSYECVFRYNGSVASSVQQATCSDTNGGGADMVIQSGHVAFYVGINGSYTIAQEPGTLIPGRWYDVVGSWDGTTNALYVDGNLAAKTAAAGTLTLPDAAAQKFVLGADASDPGVELFSPVTIGEARVYGHGLTAADALADAQAFGLYEAPPSIGSTDVAARTGQPATFHVTLSDKYMTGLVSFQYDGIDILCQAVASNGSATCTATKLPRPGRYDVEARYSGDTYYGPMSTDLTLTVTSGSSLGHQS